MNSTSRPVSKTLACSKTILTRARGRAGSNEARWAWRMNGVSRHPLPLDQHKYQGLNFVCYMFVWTANKSDFLEDIAHTRNIKGLGYQSRICLSCLPHIIITPVVFNEVFILFLMSLFYSVDCIRISVFATATTAPKGVVKEIQP